MQRVFGFQAVPLSQLIGRVWLHKVSGLWLGLSLQDKLVPVGGPDNKRAKSTDILAVGLATTLPTKSQNTTSEKSQGRVRASASFSTCFLNFVDLGFDFLDSTLEFL